MNPYYYHVKLKRVVDGDTADFYFDLGFRTTLEVRLRLKDIDTPETFRPKTEAEKVAGQTMKAKFEEILATHAEKLTCLSANIDLYGRAEAILYYKDAEGKLHSINDELKQFMVEHHLTKEDVR